MNKTELIELFLCLNAPENLSLDLHKTNHKANELYSYLNHLFVAIMADNKESLVLYLWKVEREYNALDSKIKKKYLLQTQRIIQITNLYLEELGLNKLMVF